MHDSLISIPAASAEWSHWLTGVQHDFFHTAGHHLAWQEAGAGEARMVVYSSDDQAVAWPHLRRPIVSPDGSETGLFDITSVDGYAGPLCRNCAPQDAFTAKALEAIFQHWLESGVVSAFSRFDPLLKNQLAAGAPETCPAALFEDACHGLRHQGHTISIDLELTDDAALSQYRESHLRQIRKAFKKGLTVEVDDSPAAFLEFVRLYHQTMQRNRADAHYFFSAQFLARLRDDLGAGASIHVARLEGRIVGAVFITEFQGTVQYLLGGLEENMQQLSPLKALLEGVRRWARERGNRSLHLGGGRGCNDDDPLFYFKAGFSERRHCFYTGRWILNQQQYNALVEAHRGHALARGFEAGCTDFFPAYRAPVSKLPLQELVPLA